jgi:hypothetical protein
MTVYTWTVLLLITATAAVIEAVVVGAPAFTTLPVDVVAKMGGTTSLQCTARGRQPLNYWWIKEPSQIVRADDQVISHSNGTLEFPSVNADHSGTYQCFVNNSVGVVASNSVTVEIAALDDFVGSDGLLRLSKPLGDYVVLPCNPPRSIPEATIYWTENRIKLDLNTPGSKAMVTLNHDLVLSPLSSAGAYGCVAENEFLKLTKRRVETFVAYSGTTTQSLQILYPPTDTEVVLGGTAVFQCIAVDKVVPTIEWKKIGHNSLAHPRVYTDENDRKLVISNAVAADGGTYKCVVSKSEISSAKLTVLVPPIIHEGPHDINSTIGETISLSCNTSGVPPPTVSWFKNGQNLISGTGTVTVGLDHTLVLTGVQEGDSGAYQCRSSNKAGIALYSAAVLVKGFSPMFSPVGTLRPITTSFQDSSITLSCSANGSPRPTYSWHFQDFPIGVDDNFQILQEGSLFIKNTEYKNRGKYTCIATNQKGSVNQSTVLEVYVETAFTDDAIKTYGHVGEDVNLTCHVRHDPEVHVTVHWNRPLGEIEPLAGKVAISGHVLMLYNLTKADGGDYNCFVTTRAHKQHLSVLKRTVHLAIQEPPSPPENVEASQPSSTSVKLQWMSPLFDGNSRHPLIFIIEYNSSVQGEFVPIQMQTTSLSAVIHDLSPYIDYQFRVIARNDFSEGSPSVPSIPIQTLPDTPSSFPVNLTAVPNPDSPGDSLFVQWKPTPLLYVNGPIVGYDIEYRKKHEAHSWIVVPVNGSRLNVSLTSLGPHSHYKLRIRVVNSVDVGPWSGYYSAWTSELPPSVPPMINRVEALNATSLLVKFTAPPNVTLNGILQGFKIWYWPSNVTRQEHVISNPWEYMAILVNLQPSTMYSLVMVAYNNVGSSPASSPVQQSTAKAKTNEVTNVKMNHDVENGQIWLHWGHPKQTDGTIVTYLITYVQVGDNTEETIAVDGQTREVLLKGIQSNAVYTVTIQAKSSSGQQNLWTTEVEFGKGLPSPPVNVQISVVDNQPKLRWESGADGDSEINGYKVEYKHNTQLKWQLYKSDIESATNEMTLQADLFHNSVMEYNFRVAARNEKGFGSPAVAQKRGSESSDKKEIFEELWFLIAVGVGGGVLVIAFVIIAVCCRRHAIAQKVKMANKEKDKTEEGYPSAKKAIEDGIKASKLAKTWSQKSIHSQKSTDCLSESSSAAGPPAYGNQTLEMYTTPLYSEPNTATATLSDVDKTETEMENKSECSESTVPAHMPSFGHPASDVEDEDTGAISTFV